MKIAIVHDWLTEAGGAELVLKELLIMFPQADLYTLVNFIDIEKVKFIDGREIYTSFIQKLPFAKSHYRMYLPLMPLAIEQFDLSSYNLVISSSYCVAKGVITGPNQYHISYCHSPIRYAWDLQHQYLNEVSRKGSLKSILMRYFLHKIRIWDVRTAHGVDSFIANSNFIARRIRKTYGRISKVIYPPVNTKDFNLHESKDDFYLTCSRLVPYKKIDLIVRAFNKMPDRRLVVVGQGPDFTKIKQQASPNVEILGFVEFSELVKLMEKARAFVFAAEEDFGIVPVESQACGTPVIAFGKGGSLETVESEKTGVFFYEQTEESIVDAVKRFETLTFDYSYISKRAEKFSIENFRSQILEIIEEYHQ